MNKRIVEQPNGFSLIEVLIAIAILAIGALSLVQLMALGVKLNVQTTDDTQAATLAQWKIETLNGVGYQNLYKGGGLDSDVTVTVPGTPPVDVPYFEDFSEPGSGVIYHKRWMISPCGHSDPTVDCLVSEEY